MPYVLGSGFHDQMVAWASAPLPAMAHVGGQMESQYSPAIGRAILGRLWLGETARQIGADPAMPCYATIYHWRRVHEGFRADWDAMRALPVELRRAARTRALASRPRKRDGGLGGPPSRYTGDAARGPDRPAGAQDLPAERAGGLWAGRVAGRGPWRRRRRPGRLGAPRPAEVDAGEAPC